MAQWVKALADKLGRLGLILEIYLKKKTLKMQRHESLIPVKINGTDRRIARKLSVQPA